VRIFFAGAEMLHTPWLAFNLEDFSSGVFSMTEWREVPYQGVFEDDAQKQRPIRLVINFLHIK